jgi:hypothetical protein
VPLQPPNDALFARELALILGHRFADLVREVTESQTVSESLIVTLDPREPSTAAVEVPHYWAVYYHDGRGPVQPRSPGVRFLVWFKNPDDDPRNPSGTVRAVDIRRLTEEEFQNALDAGQLVIAQEAGPAPAHPFFLEAAALFDPTELIEELLLEHLSFGLPDERVEASFRLPL